MFCEYRHKVMSSPLWKEVDELGRPTEYRGKMMVIAFLSGARQHFLNALPRSRCMDTSCFAGEIIGRLEAVSYPERRNPQQRKMALHFDRTAIHNARTITRQLQQSRSKTLEHQPSSQGLAPCGFFLFGSLKEQLKGRIFAKEKEHLSVFSEPMSETPPDMILRLFTD
jgi:hypothetical protein